VADIVIRRPDPARRAVEADAVMAVQRATLRVTLPGLHNPHTADEDREWIRGVFARFSVWLAVDGQSVVGVLSREDEWVRQLYVAPHRTGQGIGQRLLDTFLDEAAAASMPVVRLWTFQRNAGARRFYERNGFVAVEFTDGSGNEEGEPDVRYERETRKTA
jgi:putative acetyltransferase